MIDFENLTGEKLSAYGFCFESEEEAGLFADVILEELQVRIGQSITDQIGLEKAEEFDACFSEDESRKWLEENCPNFGIIVIEQEHKMEREMMAFRDKIPGLVPEESASVVDTAIEDLDLSVRSYQCLKRAGLLTVRDVLKFGDLENVRNLPMSCVEEIDDRIWQLLSLPRNR